MSVCGCFDCRELNVCPSSLIENLEAENKRFRAALVSVQLLNADAINEIGSNFIYDGVLNIRRAQEVIKEALKESE